MGSAGTTCRLSQQWALSPARMPADPQGTGKAPLVSVGLWRGGEAGEVLGREERDTWGKKKKPSIIYTCEKKISVQHPLRDSTGKVISPLIWCQGNCLDKTHLPSLPTSDWLKGALRHRATLKAEEKLPRFLICSPREERGDALTTPRVKRLCFFPTLQTGHVLSPPGHQATETGPTVRDTQTLCNPSSTFYFRLCPPGKHVQGPTGGSWGPCTSRASPTAVTRPVGQRLPASACHSDVAVLCPVDHPAPGSMSRSILASTY